MFNNTKLERAQKRASTAAEDTEDTKGIHVKRLRRSQQSKALCFICEDESATSPLRDAMTMKLNERVNECARNLSDEKLLAKLIAGDVVAQEFKYHSACLVGLYNRERDHLPQRQYDLIPPTQAALKEHAKRASYEAGYVWGQALKRHPQMQSPSNWGWVKQYEE